MLLERSRRATLEPIRVLVEVPLSEREMEAALFCFPRLERREALAEYARNKAEILMSGGYSLQSAALLERCVCGRSLKKENA